MNISLKEQIIIHVCYRDIFNAPVSIDELSSWINIGEDEVPNLSQSISELHDEGLIEIRQKFICVSDRKHLIDDQPAKNDLTTKLISENVGFLKWLGKLPFIRFIGISGSLAANNPTPDKHGVNKGAVDMDLFLITSKNSVWLFVLFERCYTNLRRAFLGPHFYCFNYVTEESFLEVYNKNFYTATEINNIKPIVNKGIFKEFLLKNGWSETYYSKAKKNDHSAEIASPGRSIWSLFWVPNFISFSLFCLLRAIKRMDLEVIKEIKLKFDPINKCNLLRISNPKGGYQEAIRSRFEENFKHVFSNYYRESLMQYLFPEDSLFRKNNLQIQDEELTEYFEKY